MTDKTPFVVTIRGAPTRLVYGYPILVVRRSILLSSLPFHQVLAAPYLTLRLENTTDEAFWYVWSIINSPLDECATPPNVEVRMSIVELCKTIEFDNQPFLHRLLKAMLLEPSPASERFKNAIRALAMVAHGDYSAREVTAFYHILGANEDAVPPTRDILLERINPASIKTNQRVTLVINYQTIIEGVAAVLGDGTRVMIGEDAVLHHSARTGYYRIITNGHRTATSSLQAYRSAPVEWNYLLRPEPTYSAFLYFVVTPPASRFTFTDGASLRGQIGVMSAYSPLIQRLADDPSVITEGVVVGISSDYILYIWCYLNDIPVIDKLWRLEFYSLSAMKAIWLHLNYFNVTEKTIVDSYLNRLLLLALSTGEGADRAGFYLFLTDVAKKTANIIPSIAVDDHLKIKSETDTLGLAMDRALFHLSERKAALPHNYFSPINKVRIPFADVVRNDTMVYYGVINVVMSDTDIPPRYTDISPCLFTVQGVGAGLILEIGEEETVTLFYGDTGKAFLSATSIVEDKVMQDWRVEIIPPVFYHDPCPG